MQFFKILLLTFFISLAQADELKDLIVTKEYGSCETNNLAYSAMRFSKIPLAGNLYLRVIFFFNSDHSMIVRTTKQELLGCETTSSGTEVCSYRPTADKWERGEYDLEGIIHTHGFGDITFLNPDNINRGFEITLPDGKKFIGGMILVNFNQNAQNTTNICRHQL